MTEDMNSSNEERPEVLPPPPRRGGRRTRWVVLLILIVIATGAGLFFYNKKGASGAAAAADGTNPAKPENMATMPSDSHTASPPADAGSAIGQIYIAPERQQLIGVKTASAEMKSLINEILTVGRVAYDETKITHIHTKVSGFIEDVFADYVGKAVKAGEPLFTIYSPDLVATQQEYLLALKSNALLKDSAFPWVSSGSTNLLEAARQRLLLWDITPDQIQAIEQRGEVQRALTIQSHVSGVVTERQAYHHGRYVTPEMDLYTIVDLSNVWVLGQVNESDLSLVKVGQMVQ